MLQRTSLLLVAFLLLVGVVRGLSRVSKSTSTTGSVKRETKRVVPVGHPISSLVTRQYKPRDGSDGPAPLDAFVEVAEKLVGQKLPGSYSLFAGGSQRYDNLLPHPECKLSVDVTGSQGDTCNSCYAHAAATSLSHRACFKGMIAPQEKVSVQQILNCAPGTGCFNGGNVVDVYLWLKDNFINLRSNPHGGPYVAMDLIKKGILNGKEACDTTWTPTALTLDSVVTGASYLPLAFAAMAREGSFAATIFIYPDFVDFKGNNLGVYTCPHGMATNALGSHWIVIMGYGNFAGQDFFIMENSWGNIYGDFDNGMHNPVKGLGPFARISADACIGYGQGGNIWTFGVPFPMSKAGHRIMYPSALNVTTNTYTSVSGRSTSWSFRSNRKSKRTDIPTSVDPAQAQRR